MKLDDLKGWLDEHEGWEYEADENGLAGPEHEPRNAHALHVRRHCEEPARGAHVGVHAGQGRGPHHARDGLLLEDERLEQGQGRRAQGPSQKRRVKAPRIEHYTFGRITIDGKIHTADVIVLPGRVIPDWWREDGHRLGAADVEEIVAAGPACLVVGTGASGLMEVPRGNAPACSKATGSGSWSSRRRTPSPPTTASAGTAARPPACT